MNLQKQKRMIDSDFLMLVRSKPCVACYWKKSETASDVCAHHIKSKKSGGPDDAWNIMPLCQEHHTEIHWGMTKFVEKYPPAKVYLKALGWEFDSRKWIYPRNDL